MENLNNLPPFYIGQKVVYIGGCKNIYINLPKENTEVCIIIAKSVVWENSWILKGYEYGKDGRPQSFNSKNLAPVQEQKFPLIKLTKVLEEQLICEN